LYEAISPYSWEKIFDKWTQLQFITGKLKGKLILVLQIFNFQAVFV